MASIRSATRALAAKFRSGRKLHGASIKISWRSVGEPPGAERPAWWLRADAPGGRRRGERAMVEGCVACRPARRSWAVLSHRVFREFGRRGDYVPHEVSATGTRM